MGKEVLTRLCEREFISDAGNRLTREEERELLRRWREEGDRDAYNQLAISLGRVIAAETAKFLKARRNFWLQSSDKQDMMADARQGILEAILRVDLDRGRLCTLAALIVRRRLIKYNKPRVRRLPRPQPLTDDRNYRAPQPHTEQKAELEDLVSRVQKDLRRFSPEDQRLLQMRHYQGLTCEEIGKRTKREPNTVRRQLLGIYKRWRDIFGKKLDYAEYSGA